MDRQELWSYYMPGPTACPVLQLSGKLQDHGVGLYCWAAEPYSPLSCRGADVCFPGNQQPLDPTCANLIHTGTRFSRCGLSFELRFCNTTFC